MFGSDNDLRYEVHDEEEDDPLNWDDVGESSWSMEHVEISTGLSVINTTRSKPMPLEENESSTNNPQLQNIQIEMDKMRSAMRGKGQMFTCDLNDYSKRRKIDAPQMGNCSYRISLQRKLLWLFGPLEIHYPITAPSIRILQGVTTSQYVRDLSQDHAGSYVFRRIPSASLPTDSYFCLELIPGESQTGVKVSLTAGVEVITLPNLLEQINYEDDNIVLIETQTINDQGERGGCVSIFFESRALFLENIYLKSFIKTPLSSQQETIEIITEFIDPYKLGEWRDTEKESRERPKPKIVTLKQEEDYVAKSWRTWKKTYDGRQTFYIFSRKYIRGTILLGVLETLFDYICDDVCILHGLRIPEFIRLIRRCKIIIEDYTVSL